MSYPQGPRGGQPYQQPYQNRGQGYDNHQGYPQQQQQQQYGNNQPQQQYHPHQQQQQQQHHHQQQQHHHQQQQQAPQQQQQQQAAATPTTYNAERVIGSGSFGVVYQARVVPPGGPTPSNPGEVVAIKRVYLDPEFKNRELQIMSELNHPSVITLKHCFYTQHEQTKTYLNLVMPFLPDSVHRVIRSHSKSKRYIPVDNVRRYIYQILRGLAYIHDLGICHRDLKPQNILINESNHDVRICDFGSAKKLKPEEPNVSYICSRYYRAPELALEAKRYTNAVDVWSAGCVFAELLTSRPLFAGETSSDQILRIISILGTPTPEDYRGMGLMEADCRNIITKALTTDSQGGANTQLQRDQLPPNFIIQGQGLQAALHRDEVPQEAIDLLQAMLDFNPKTRIDAFEALYHPFFDPIHMAERVDLPGLGYEGQSLYAWETQQHCWTEREAQLMRQKAMKYPNENIVEKLLPIWSRDIVGRRVQEIAGRDLHKLYFEHKNNLGNVNDNNQHDDSADYPREVELRFDAEHKQYIVKPVFDHNGNVVTHPQNVNNVNNNNNINNNNGGNNPQQYQQYPNQQYHPQQQLLSTTGHSNNNNNNNNNTNNNTTNNDQYDINAYPSAHPNPLLNASQANDNNNVTQSSMPHVPNNSNATAMSYPAESQSLRESYSQQQPTQQFSNASNKLPLNAPPCEDDELKAR